MANIQIVVGSVMGTAHDLALKTLAFLESRGFEVTLLEPFNAESYHRDHPLLVITSTTGMGDLPGNLAEFFRFLDSSPNIVGQCYGVISLGDSSYPNFAEAGKTIDTSLESLGAQRLAESLTLDAIYVEDHFEDARTWLLDWSQIAAKKQSAI